MPGCAAATIPGPATPRSSPGPGSRSRRRSIRVGIPFDGVSAVAVSHLHLDHAGGLKRLFAGRVPVHAQRRELEYGLSGDPAVEANDIFRVDFDDPRIDWRLAAGDAQIAPGVTAISTPGHTPGHQSFMVELDPSAGGGGFVFAFDAADLTENIDGSPADRIVHPGLAQDALEPTQRLKGLSQRGPARRARAPTRWCRPALHRRGAQRFWFGDASSIRSTDRFRVEDLAGAVQRRTSCRWWTGSCTR